MNYRHIYHAGNICDVVKHAVLTLLITHLQTKDKACAILDTHAGIGLYDLYDPRALKTGEAAAGIKQLRSSPPIASLKAYADLLTLMNPQGGLGYYPGSPLIASKLLRPQDRLMLCELHPEDAAELRRHVGGNKQIQIHHRDGYEALGALLPPAEKRGLVLIDPPFEVPDEFDRLVEALQTTTQRWPQGQVAIWYPIKERPAIWRFHEALMATGIPKLLCAEFLYAEEIRADGLNGCGFIFCNPPYQFDQELAALFPQLHTALATPYQGVKVDWLSPA